jgi:hypothetical protein
MEAAAILENDRGRPFLRFLNSARVFQSVYQISINSGLICPFGSISLIFKMAVAAILKMLLTRCFGFLSLKHERNVLFQIIQIRSIFG